MAQKFDLPRIQAILTDFYQLTGFRVGIYTPELEMVAEYPQEHCALCALVRSRARGQCRKSDMAHGQLACTGSEFSSYACHAGLTESLAPIRSERALLGYLMIGQLRTDPTCAAQKSQLKRLARKWGLDFSALQSAYDAMPVVPAKQITAAAHILQVCAAHLCAENMVAPDRQLLPVRFSDYLAQNYAGHVTLDKLCAALGVGKSTLTASCQAHFGASPMELVTRQRIRRAQTLLRQSSLSVAQIAENTGFADPNYFAKVFRRQ
ncbi:MAG: PocR ligand-binding domain-containing protein, partial [Eubacteriales bacterium]|nr:PocR ligand-binding domain-containing protein [Eubacteriales bacterium]